jgi:hypothetical protein
MITACICCAGLLKHSLTARVPTWSLNLISYDLPKDFFHSPAGTMAPEAAFWANIFSASGKGACFAIPPDWQIILAAHKATFGAALPFVADLKAAPEVAKIIGFNIN